MSVSKLQSRFVSAALGVFCGVLIISSLVVGPRVSAEGGWCPDTIEQGVPCINGYCFKPIAGTERCVYQGTGVCNTAQHACTPEPPGGD